MVKRFLNCLHDYRCIVAIFMVSSHVIHDYPYNNKLIALQLKNPPKTVITVTVINLNTVLITSIIICANTGTLYFHYAIIVIITQIVENNIFILKIHLLFI